MNALRVYWRDLTDGELLSALESLGVVGSLRPAGGLECGFVEGPARAGFVELPAPLSAAEIGALWIVRAFGPDTELAARRLSFAESGTWRVRWIGTSKPAGDWNEGGELERRAAESALVLYGEAREDGKFREGRFAAAGEIAYPGITGTRGAVVALDVESYAARGGSIVRWRRLKLSHEARAKQGRS